MRVHALWYGGSNYSAPDGYNTRDWEAFASLAAARQAFESRADFDPYYPCVDRSADENAAQMHVYFAEEYHENGPDRIIRFGRRGGVIVERG